MTKRQLANDKDKTERMERGTAQFVFLSVGKTKKKKEEVQSNVEGEVEWKGRGKGKGSKGRGDTEQRGEKKDKRASSSILRVQRCPVQVAVAKHVETVTLTNPCTVYSHTHLSIWALILS